MLRFLPVIPLMLWLLYAESAPVATRQPGGGVVLMCGMYAAGVLLAAAWGRAVTGRVDGLPLPHAIRRFTRGVALFRGAGIVWFGVSVHLLGWGAIATRWTQVGNAAWGLQLPGIVVGTAPVYLAWIGLWWAQYPAYRALRERSMLVLLEEALPVHAPPTLGRYVLGQLRQELGMPLAPLLAVFAAKDVMALALHATGLVSPDRADAGAIEAGVYAACTAGVFVMAPELLRRLLRTAPLSEGALRDRLEALARRAGVKYADILLWRTDGAVATALVMGVMPAVRYVAMSDLLLERMPDERLEAVFAHEAGHVAHRHMLWFVPLLVCVFGAMWWAATWFDRLSSTWGPAASAVGNIAMLLAGIGAAVGAFAWVSRRFERQADVFAARMVGRGGVRRGPVPADGAAVVHDTLLAVADVNNLPRETWSLTHGSLAGRAAFVMRLAGDPALARRFDVAMVALRLALVGGVLATGAAIAFAR